MHISAQAPLHLLHRSAIGTLATHLREPQGFPYPTMLPFALDARHRPVLLVSRLAEHTRNLESDARAGFLVAEAAGPDVLAGERVTLIGRFLVAPTTPELARRYLRYRPEAERYLALGDFSFRVMEVDKLRYIGGFGSMGWLDGSELDPLDPLSDENEIFLLDYFNEHAGRPSAVELLGIDCYGADLKAGDVRRRFVFDAPKPTVPDLQHALADCIARLAE
jgi:hypothetical protein